MAAVTTRGLVTTSLHDSLDLAAQIMLWAGISHLPVLQDGRLVGVLAERDLIGRHPEGERVQSAMSVPAMSLHPNADIECASRRLIERGVSFMPIADDDGRLLGVVTAGDVLEAREAPARGRRAGPAAGSLATRAVATVQLTDTLADALARMSAAGHQSVPVVDADGRLVGTLGDRDVRAALGPPSLLHDRKNARARLAETLVGDVMTGDAIALPADAPLSEVLSCLTRNHIGAVPIVDEERRVTAMISFVDVLNAIASA
jgi:CBS domain-containing protein